MILVDTSVWVDHLQACDAQLVSLLRAGNMPAHPFVIGEIAPEATERRHLSAMSVPCLRLARLEGR